MTMIPRSEIDKGQITTPDELLKLAAAFRQSRIILTAFELGVFTALATRKRTSVDVAKALGVDGRGLDRLMNALCALGLLRKWGCRFSTTSFSEHYLIKGKHGYLGGLVHTVNLWNSWTTLTKAVSHGGTVLHRQARKGSERKRVQGFIAAMQQRAFAQASATVRLLDLSAAKKTLDVGGGSGAFSTALVRAKNDIQATVFDLPDVIPLTRSYVSESGLSRQFTFQAGNFHKDEFDKGYDLILLSAIIHMNSVADNKRLFKKCAGVLNSRGQLVVQDYIMNENRTRPAAGTFFALNMLVGTDAGDTYTEKEVRRWMKLAELTKVRRIETPYDSSLMIGRKI
jgi:2-polyprenyl-3-methyl-5-hydroxy-6-metoxy-1,4-benzoquinol methylase